MRYPRNEFLFNFAVAVDATIDPRPYEDIVRTIAETLKQGEVYEGWVSREEEEDSSASKVREICAVVMDEVATLGEGHVILST